MTQNIDGLHQAAGSKKVYELHGSIHRNYCMKCGKFYDAEYVKKSEGVPHCSCGGEIKPDVVLYEEGLDAKTMDGAVRAIGSADTLIIGGTSLVVYPAAGFIDYFRESTWLLSINPARRKQSGQTEHCSTYWGDSWVNPGKMNQKAGKREVKKSKGKAPERKLLEEIPYSDAFFI